MSGVSTFNFADAILTENGTILLKKLTTASFNNMSFDVNAKSKKGCPGFISAVQYGFTNFINFLIEKGVDQTRKDDVYGDTALIRACRHASMEVIKKLNLSTLNTQNNHGDTPLHEAVYYQNYNAQLYLLQKGADISLQDINGENALTLSILMQDDKSTKILFPYYKDIFTQVNKRNENILFHSLRVKNIKLSEHLATLCSVDVCTQVDIYGNTCLMEMIGILSEDFIINHIKEFEKRCTIYSLEFYDKQNRDSFTILLYSVIRGCKKLATFLIQRGCNCNLHSSGNTPLFEATRKGYMDLCELLCKHKVNINFQNNSGNTVLIEAVLKNNYTLVKLYLKYSCNKEIKNKYGKRALDEAQAIAEMLAEEENLNLPAIEENKKIIKLLS